MAMTSSSVLNLMTTATGPKISSWATRMSLVALTIRVGFMKLPLAQAPSV